MEIQPEQERGKTMKIRTEAGTEMARLRKEKDLTQAELAQILGVSQRMVAACEAAERRPSAELAKKIGAELGMKWTEFFEEDEEEAAAL
jgi:transcriptional regulator with XRE-family HTH domain